MKSTIRKKPQIIYIGVFILVIFIETLDGQGCLQAAGGQSLSKLKDNGRDVPRLHHRHQAIIPSYQFTCCGEVRSWGVDVQPGGNMEVMGYTIVFQVWRPSSDSEMSGCYTLVGENRFTSLTPEDSVIRISSSRIARNERISVRPDDVIGFYVESSNSRPDDRGLSLDTSYTNEEMWFAMVGTNEVVDPSATCQYPIGRNGMLTMSTNIAPFLSVSIATSECPVSTSEATTSTLAPPIDKPSTQQQTAVTSTLNLRQSLTSTVIKQPQIMTTSIANKPHVQTSTITEQETLGVSSTVVSTTSTITQQVVLVTTFVESTSRITQLPTITSSMEPLNPTVQVNNVVASSINSLWVLFAVGVQLFVLGLVTILVVIVVLKKKSRVKKYSVSRQMTSTSSNNGLLGRNSDAYETIQLQGNTLAFERELSQATMMTNVESNHSSYLSDPADFLGLHETREYTEANVILGVVPRDYSEIDWGLEEREYQDVTPGTTTNATGANTQRNDYTSTTGFTNSYEDIGNGEEGVANTTMVYTEVDVVLGLVPRDYSEIGLEQRDYDEIDPSRTNILGANTEENDYTTTDFTSSYDYVRNDDEAAISRSPNGNQRQSEETLLRSLPSNDAYTSISEAFDTRNGSLPDETPANVLGATTEENDYTTTGYSYDYVKNDDGVFTRRNPNASQRQSLLSSLRSNDAYEASMEAVEKRNASALDETPADVNSSSPLVVGKFQMKRNAAYNAKKFVTSQPTNNSTQEAEYIVGEYLQATSAMPEESLGPHQADLDHSTKHDAVASQSSVIATTSGETQTFNMKVNVAYNPKKFGNNPTTTDTGTESQDTSEIDRVYELSTPNASASV